MIGTIAPPGQGWHEAPGWWFKHGVDRHLLQITDLLLEIDPPPAAASPQPPLFPQYVSTCN